MRIVGAFGAVLCAITLGGCVTDSTSQPGPDIGWRPPGQHDEPLQPSYEYPAQVFAWDLQSYSSIGEGAEGLTVELAELDRAVVVIATRTGALDDSVEGVQERVVLELRDDGRWHVRERGFRFRCWRGDPRRRWTIELCP